MTNVLLSAIDFASQLVDSVMRPEDRMLLITFDRRPRLVQGATNDRALLQARLHGLTAVGDTALADALAFSMQQFNGLAGKRAIVLVTDGNEASSQQTITACMQLAKEIGVPMYVLVPQDALAPRSSAGFRRMLSDMADVTGGLFFDHPKDEAVPAIVERIRNEVRGQYLLSFSAPQTAHGWRPLRVTVPGKAATVRTVSGYQGR
jgi:VWFA-related protein